MWSPNSLGGDAMKTRIEPGNPGARKHVHSQLQLFVDNRFGETLRDRALEIYYGESLGVELVEEGVIVRMEMELFFNNIILHVSNTI